MSWYSSQNQQQQTDRHAAGGHKVITNAVTNAGLIRITATAHGYSTSNKVDVTGVLGVPNANGVGWVITVIDVNTFDLQGSVFAGAYTSGGLAHLQ